MDTRTIFLFSIALVVLLVAVYLVTSQLFWRISLRAGYQTVRLPVQRVQKYRNSKQEHAFTVDYQDGSSEPKRIWITKGDNSSVRPKEVAEAEAIIHTHPKMTRATTPLETAYENELRERPSAADLRHLDFSSRDQEFVMTPSGKVIKYEKTPRAKRGFFGKIRSSFRLSRAELSSQETVIQNAEVNTPGDAKQLASESNRLFLKEARREGFRVTRLKGDTTKLEVKD
ncbi:MAG: hypothetical protein ACFFD4_02590 [Candidatus Odinarchaeota archaeon]